jgi:predicted nuclease with TOPRIM domain
MFVKISDYNKLKAKFEKIKRKNEKMLEKNKELTDLTEDLMKNYKAIEESKKNVDLILKGLQETVKNLIQQSQKPKEEYSKTSSGIEIKSDFHKANITSENISVNIFLLKMLDEMEACYNQMSNNFSNSVKKYKMIKDEYDNLTIDNTKLLKQIKIMNNEYNLLAMESNQRQNTILRFKEIDRCLVNTSLNTLVLNNNEHRKMSNREDQPISIKNIPYITCEPIPSFLKFLNKAY